jgi:hypothetical protein
VGGSVILSASMRKIIFRLVRFDPRALDSEKGASGAVYGQAMPFAVKTAKLRL